MKYIVGCERKLALFILALLCAGVYSVAAYANKKDHTPLDREKLAVTTKLLDAQGILLRARSKRHVEISPDDTLHTGWIGVSESPYTTDPGSLAAKRSTTNPNFGAAILDMLAESGVKKGDVVAIGMSGSFPALNTAVIVAVEELGAEPIIISSVGSSPWGANQHSFLWPRIEKTLYRAGIISHRSSAVGTGGSMSLGSEKLDSLMRVAKASHRRVIDDMNIKHSVETRLAIYKEKAKGRKISVFVNIGGAVANVGIDSKTHNNIKQGTYTALGVMGIMRKQGTPVIDLRNIHSICKRYGLPWDPPHSPTVGEGHIFYGKQSSKMTIGICLLVQILLVSFVLMQHKPGFWKGVLELGDPIYQPAEILEQQCSEVKGKSRL